MNIDHRCTIKTKHGDFFFCVDPKLNDEMYVLHLGQWDDLTENPLIRVHSACCFSEIFGDRSCDCNQQLDQAMKLIALEGKGIIFYLKQEGRGQGIFNKTTAISYMQNHHCDSDTAYKELGYEIDRRDYQEVAKTLKAQGISKVRLLSNNPAKVSGLKQYGIDVELFPIAVPLQEHNQQDVLSRQIKHNHHCPDIFFSDRDGNFAFLSNLSAYSVQYQHPDQSKVTEWSTVEHAYQASKFIDSDLIEEIRGQADPLGAKKIAYLNQSSWREDWEHLKVPVMTTLLAKKVQQHQEVKDALLTTTQSNLIELSEEDLFWGRNSKGIGANKLGEIWMDLRRSLTTVR